MQMLLGFDVNGAALNVTLCFFSAYAGALLQSLTPLTGCDVLWGV